MVSERPISQLDMTTSDAITRGQLLVIQSQARIDKILADRAAAEKGASDG